ncbi:MAG: hypothetical protein WC529_08860 [Candidatus Margulisiibacteriota bacterium]
MREVFYTLGALALLHHLGVPVWAGLPFLTAVLFFDHDLRQRDAKAQAEIEVQRMKIMMGLKK